MHAHIFRYMSVCMRLYWYKRILEISVVYLYHYLCYRFYGCNRNPTKQWLTLDQNFSTLALLTFLDHIILGNGNFLVYCRMFSSITGLYPQMSETTTLSQLMSPKCPLGVRGAKLSPPKNHWARYKCASHTESKLAQWLCSTLGTQTPPCSAVSRTCPHHRGPQILLKYPDSKRARKMVLVNWLC